MHPCEEKKDGCKELLTLPRITWLFNFHVLYVVQDDEMALHIACRYYDPSNQRKIDVCVILIEAGADYQKKNRVSKT